MFLLALKKKVHLWVLRAIKPVVGTTGKGGYNQWQKVREEWDNLDRIKTFCSASVPNIWDGMVEV
jgi:hypothetical protein